MLSHLLVSLTILIATFVTFVSNVNCTNILGGYYAPCIASSIGSLLSMDLLTLSPLSYLTNISTILVFFLGCFGLKLLRNTVRTLIIFGRMQEKIVPSAAHSIIEGAGKRNTRREGPTSTTHQKADNKRKQSRCT
jgi:hypothetical protein